YHQEGSRTVDLVGDFVGREPFIIDGDSLLLQCFANKKLDFHPGFQVLHATYLVERLLQKLQQRRCVCEIVFFDQSAQLCVPTAIDRALHDRYLLAREAIIQHLISISLRSPHCLRVRKFQSFRSMKFEEHLVKSGAYLFMCHDGASENQVDGDEKGSEDSGSEGTESDDSSEEEVDENRFEVSPCKESSRVEFRRMIHWFIARGRNISLINSLEFRDTKVMSIVIEGTFTRKNWILLQQETLGLSTLTLESTPSSDHSVESSGHGSLDLEEVKTMIEKVIHKQSSLTQRQCLLVVTLGIMLGNITSSSRKITMGATSMILHLVLLQHTKLGDRGVQISNSKNSNEFLNSFLRLAKDIISSAHWEKATHNLPCDLADLFDGRTFFWVYTMIETCGINGVISSTTLLPFNDLISLVNHLGGTELQLADSRVATEVAIQHKNRPEKSKSDKNQEDKKQPSSKNNAKSRKGAEVLPFQSPVFDDHLKPFRIQVDDSTGAENNPKGSKGFKEDTHWHNSRPLDSKKAPKLSPKDLLKQNKRNQFYMKEMLRYAESLSGSAGISQGEIVVVGSTSTAKSKSNQSPQVRSQPATGKASGREKAATASQQKTIEEEKKQRAKWTSKLKLMEKSSLDPLDRFHAMEEYLTSLSKDSRIFLEAEVLAYLLDTSVQALSRHEVDQSHTMIMTHIWGVLSRLMKLKRGISNDIRIYVQRVCQHLELPAVSLSKQTGQPLSFKPVTLPKKPNSMIGVSQVEFQLLHGGPFMERSIGSLPDPRTPDFDPDRWQREVLDQIDTKQSAFIVAPTSAGKTFISFYAMRQILKEDNEGILIYVAPTKALVNQIAAEVQARFSKKYPAKATAKQVWAIHTRDHRINSPTGCQILITVPHILQIMLLSPIHAKSWTPRLRRIIFDEIHCIGQAEDGVIWEQLLLLAPCPIIALSATVGNPEEFYEWLKHAQRTNGHELKMIQHKHRYSDLRNYVYCPPPVFSFKGFSNVDVSYQWGLDEAGDMKFMHPVLSLGDRSRAIPTDFSLEPRDCLSLWKAMSDLQTDDFPVNSSLSPSSFFSGIISKKDVIEWQKPLIELVNNWKNDRRSPFEALLFELGRQSTGSSTTVDNAEKASLSHSQPQGSSMSHTNGNDEDDVLLSTTLPLICSLHDHRALPALFFNYDRSKCEKIGKHLLKKLREAESQWKSENSAWKAKVDKWKDWKKADAVSKKKVAKPTKKKRSEDQPTSHADGIRDLASGEGSMLELFDPERPVEMFSLADPKKLSRSEFLEYITDFKWRDIPDWLTDALERGIGVHHAGMNRKYRQVCEMLFRKGFLRVVIATGTLALGINMPCKTVVFSGDSLFLTALNFRQAAGRAGRRGFDLLGNVVFQHVPTAKIHRLVSSRLPDLNGHFPITTSLILRLFILLDGSNQAASAVKSINSLLSSPRICLGGSETKDTVLHYLRFSIEYLRRNDLIDGTGAPLNFAGCVSHLYFTESSSFAFHAFLSSGYFEDVCKDFGRAPESNQTTLQTLMLVMCHIFKRQRLRQSTLESYRTAEKSSSSIVVLPHLPKKAAQALKNHNRQVLDIYTGYVSTFIDQHIDTPDCDLPLSHTKCGGDTSALEVGVMKSHSLNPAPKIISPFYALSGHKDWRIGKSTVADLCETIRDGVWLEESVVPYVPGSSSHHPLNAYLFDFFKHGNAHELERANGVRRGDVWYELNDFSMILRVVTASLGNILNPRGNSDVDMLDVTGGGELREVEADDNIADVEVKDEPGKKVSTTPAGKVHTSVAPSASVKKHLRTAQPLDSWEDDMDEEEQAPVQQEPSNTQPGRKMDNLQSLTLVYKAFNALQTEFDEKFKKMWA
ncbi:DEAD/DEAH box helicase, partial [Penicillium odoratum]|uniref:DEAD/DEAH box helicase n=1 Tax=Penicillium odoratum TaxID=1167516 RepID=UPI00254759CB